MEEYVYITKYGDIITGAYRTKEDAMCYNPEGLSFGDFEQEYKENNILRGCLYYEKIPLM